MGTNVLTVLPTCVVASNFNAFNCGDSPHFKFAYNLKELFCLSLEFLFVQKYFVFCSYKADYLFHFAGYSILYLFSDNVASVTQYTTNS